MTSSEKVVLLNNFTDKTLSITHFTEWELSSYGKDSAFRRNGQFGPIRSKSFAGCVNMAFELAGGGNEK